jgi:DNA-directed RNA polymerase I, II, and III subunit RPABC5
MIIPIRCFTCNKVIADKWEYYVKRCEELEEINRKASLSHETNNKKSELKYFEKNFKKEILDELGLNRMCCRRMFLGHVDLIDHI